MEDTKALEKMIELTLWSGYLKDERPLSLMIIARPESGKTETLRLYKFNKGVAYLTDATAYGITRDILPHIKDGKVRHIIIPDLLKPLSRKESTVNNFVTFMNALIEEGVSNMSSYIISTQEEKEVRCGLITSMTDMEFFDRRHGWNKLGFMSRLLPFTYSYSLSSINKIYDYIMEGKYQHDNPIALNFPQEDKEITLPKDSAYKIVGDSRAIAEANKLYGFRLQRHFQCLLKANALMSGRNVVNQTDVDDIRVLLEWVNFRFNPLR